MEAKTYSIAIEGRTLNVEFTTLAERAHGSCMVRLGDSVVLATAVAGEEKTGIDFVPLTVEYEEKFYASGAIMGSRFLRREGRPSDHAILAGRAVDRALRPLFPKNLRREVQIIITVLAVGEDDPDVLATLASSLALGTSHIPWSGPVSAVRVGKDAGENFSINPTYAERTKNGVLDLFVCGTGEKVVMLEMSGKEIKEDIISSALEHALPELGKLQNFQQKIIGEIGKGKDALPEKEAPVGLEEIFTREVRAELENALFSSEEGAVAAIEGKWLESVKSGSHDIRESEARDYFHTKARELFRSGLLSGRRRGDRKSDEIRSLHASVGNISPVLHGSGTFYRGGTHVLSVLTLGGPEDALLIDSAKGDTKKRFMHHYNFPPFSTGNTGRVGGTNRRMTGHGALAEKALELLIPSREEFPYTIRLVSECLSSDGSTSMASVCASTLALMDGGVPLLRPVAGIALGLVSEGDRQTILTDIEGREDHYGDMDFKIAGTREGITALQLDVKVPGVSVSTLRSALKQGKAARESVLATLTQTISEPRKHVSSRAPHILKLLINKEKIGAVIGLQGKTIREIQEKTGAEISVEDTGEVFIVGRNGSAEEAQKIVEEITHEYQRGERFTGTVSKVTSFGVFVRLGHGAEGLLHVSEMAVHGKSTGAFPQEGTELAVTVKDIDDRGRISLSLA